MYDRDWVVYFLYILAGSFCEGTVPPPFGGIILWGIVWGRSLFLFIESGWAYIFKNSDLIQHR